MIHPSGTVEMLGLPGGAVRRLQIKGWAASPFVAWSADGKSLFAVTQSPKGNAILHVDLEGNAQVLWQRATETLTAPDPSPDGRYFAFSQATRESNAWMMENF